MSRFVLRTGRPRKDGKVTLTFNGYVNGNRIFCGTGLAVRPEDWDDFRQQVRRTDTNYAYVNAKLKEISARLQQEASRIEGSDYEAIDRLRKEFSKRKKVVKVEKPQ